MALAAVIHHFVFSRRDFKSGALPTDARMAPAAAFLSAMPHDVVAEGQRVGGEVAHHLAAAGQRVGGEVAHQLAAVAAAAKLGGRAGGASHAKEGAAVVEWHATPLRAAAAAAAPAPPATPHEDH
jgi:hypothetical protein